MRGAYLGAEFEEVDVDRRLREAGSILGDGRSPSMQSPLNLKVNYRESFRLFAPSVWREDVADWFEMNTDSPTCCWWLMFKRALRHDRRAAEAVRHREAECTAQPDSRGDLRGLFGTRGGWHKSLQIRERRISARLRKP